MLKRSIIILPDITDGKMIDELRQQYDPLFSKIGPHISLVFPFESHLTNEMICEHIRNTLVGVGAFEVVFRGVTGDWPSGYLYLTIKEGNDQLIALHDQLYQGLLSPYLWREVHYMPHVTLGHITDYHAFREALRKTETWCESYKIKVKSVVMETIDDDEQSHIEYICYLKET